MSRPTRTLLLVHQAFVGPGEAGGTRHLDLARYLIAAGWQVVVITSPISYLSGRDTGPAGNAEPGLTIRRARVYRRLFGSPAHRVLNFASFAVSAGWLALREPAVDVVFATSPPLFQALGAAAVARLRRRPLLVEVRDLWPDMAVELGILRNRLAIAAARWAERWLYRRADRIVINSPGFRAHLERAGAPPDRILEIPNGVEADAFERPTDPARYRRAWGLEDRFVALYAGAHGPANDLGQLLDAADRLRHRPDIAFVLVGDGSAKPDLIVAARRRGLANLHFVAAQPKEDMPDVLVAADVCLATLRPIPLFATTYPNKVFDYLAAGKPTILTIDGPIRRVVEVAGAGCYVRPDSPADLAGAVLAYAEDPARVAREGQSGRSYIRRHFDRAIQGRRLVEAVEALVGKRRSTVHGGLAKRLLDVTLATAGLALAAPICLAAAVAIKATSPGPILYTSERIGRAGRPFRLYKFRTMVLGAERRGLGLRVAAGDDRITPVGRLLRETSLDELPQLWNVVRGEMSLVGPRPTVRSQVERYTDYQRRRLEVRPGLTGWAQVNGRNNLSWEERIDLDVWCVDHRSLWLDLKILARTPGVVLRREGHYGPAGRTRDLGETPLGERS